MLRLDDLKALLQQRLAGLAGIPAVKEDVEGIVVPVLRINAVCGEAAAQTVGGSCMGIMLSTIFSPVIRRPSREITAEIAHPDGMRGAVNIYAQIYLQAPAE